MCLMLARVKASIYCNMGDVQDHSGDGSAMLDYVRPRRGTSFCSSTGIFVRCWKLTTLTLPILYIVVVGFSALRYYINAAVVLEETGHMDLVDGKTPKEVWKEKSG